MNYLHLPLNELTLKKSNALVNAKYASTLLENQIVAIAQSRIEYDNTNRDNPVLKAVLYPSELKELIGNPTNIYKTLKSVSKSILDHPIFVGKGKDFKMFQMVNSATYENGIFSIEFNHELVEHMFINGGHYTTFQLSTLVEFKRNVTYRLYELLHTLSYKSEVVVADFSLTELRFNLNLIDIDDEDVKEIIDKNKIDKEPDWEKIYAQICNIKKYKEIYDEKTGKTIVKEEHIVKYKEWKDFDKYVLKLAQKEMKEKSDICFEYEPKKQGRKVAKIRFTILRNAVYKDEKKQQILDENKKKQLQNYIKNYSGLFTEFVGHNELDEEDIKAFINLAIIKGNDEEVVEDVIRRSIYYTDDKGVNGTINNYNDYIASVISNKYYETQPAIVRNTIISSERKDEVQEIVRKMNSNEFLTTNWIKIKQKDDYEQFLLENDITTEYIELIYDNPKERIDLYIEWKRGRV